MGGNGIDVAVQASGFSISLSIGQITTWRLPTAPDPASCSVQYREAVAAGSEPTVTVTTTGC